MIDDIWQVYADKVEKERDTLKAELAEAVRLLERTSEDYKTGMTLGEAAEHESAIDAFLAKHKDTI